MRAVLVNPKRQLIVSVPVKMDNGTIKVFEAFACSTTSPAGRQRAASGIIPA